MLSGSGDFFRLYCITLAYIARSNLTSISVRRRLRLRLSIDLAVITWRSIFIHTERLEPCLNYSSRAPDCLSGHNELYHTLLISYSSSGVNSRVIVNILYLYYPETWEWRLLTKACYTPVRFFMHRLCSDTMRCCVVPCLSQNNT